MISLRIYRASSSRITVDCSSDSQACRLSCTAALLANLPCGSRRQSWITRHFFSQRQDVLCSREHNVDDEVCELQQLHGRVE